LQEAHRIRLQLQQQFGADSVFIDRKIPPGQEFDKFLEAELKRCDAIVAVMGNDFFRTKKKKGDETKEETDYVRWEIETALQMEIPVFPIIVGKQKMPREQDLPDGLKAYAKKQALYAVDPAFESAVDELVNALKTIQLISRHEVESPNLPSQMANSVTLPKVSEPLASWQSALSFIGCIVLSGVCIDYLNTGRLSSFDLLPVYMIFGSTYLSTTLLVGLGPLLFYKLVSVLRARLYMPVGDGLSILLTASAYMVWVTGFLLLAIASGPAVLFSIFDYEMPLWFLLVPVVFLGACCAMLLGMEMNLRAQKSESPLMTLLPWLHTLNLAIQGFLIYLILAVAIVRKPFILSSLGLFFVSSLVASIVIGYWHLHWGKAFKGEGATSHFALTALVTLAWIIITLSSFSRGLAKLLF
jgi:hypothetical protein